MVRISEQQKKRLQRVAQATYGNSHQKIGGYRLDHELSGRRVKVYHHPKENRTIVAHRGSQGLKDFAVSDAALVLDSLLGTNLQTKTKRYKHAEKIQKQAEQKYKETDLTTVGHSLGGHLARKVGSKGKVVTFNSAYDRFGGGSVDNPSEINYRNQHDIVSKFFFNPKNTIIKKAKSMGILNDHTIGAT